MTKHPYLSGTQHSHTRFYRFKTLCFVEIVERQIATLPLLHKHCQIGSTSVVFTSTHQPNPNTPSTYLWSFGDGDTSSMHSPIHTYAQPGTYIYCLLVDACPMVCDTVVVSNTGSPLQCNAEFVVDTVNSQPGSVILWNTSNVVGGNPISTQVKFLLGFW